MKVSWFIILLRTLSYKSRSFTEGVNFLLSIPSSLENLCSTAIIYLIKKINTCSLIQFYPHNIYICSWIKYYSNIQVRKLKKVTSTVCHCIIFVLQLSTTLAWRQLFCQSYNHNIQLRYSVLLFRPWAYSLLCTVARFFEFCPKDMEHFFP